MDGSKPRRYRAIRQGSKPPPLNRRFSSLHRGVKALMLTEKLRFVDLALPLPAPALPDNLLLASVKNAPILMKLTITSELDDQMEAGDTLELVLNGVAQGAAKELDLTPFLGKAEIDIALAPGDHQTLPEGRVDINYIVHFRSVGTETADGPAGQFYTTDYTVPGRPFLGQLVFSDEVLAHGVTEAALVNPGPDAYLPAKVPGYTGLQPGDLITGIVGDIEETVDAIPAEDDMLELHFRRDFIVQHEDGPITFGWVVTDRAGNKSEPAEEVTLNVLLKHVISDLATPKVPAYDDDADPAPKLIDEADARAVTGLQVIIPANDNILEGDTIIVLWGDVEIGPVPIDDPKGDPLAIVGVSYEAVRDAWVAATGGGATDAEQSLDVSYRVVRNEQSAGEPKTKAPVKVNLYQAGGVDPDPETPENDNLARAVLKSASADAPEKYNIIPPEDFGKTATITIPWLRTDTGTPPAFAEGDTLRVRYGKANLPDRKINAQDVTDAKDIDVPLTEQTIATEGSGKTIPLQYFIDRPLGSGGPNTSMSPVQAIDASGPDELPGGGSLPALDVPEAHDNIPGQPDRLAITRVQGHDGTAFEIPPYRNQKPTDTIVINVEVFRSSYTVVDHANERPANGEGARNITIVDIHPEDETSMIIVQVTEAQLMHYELTPQSTHGHIVYTVTSEERPLTPVTSAELLVDIDSRGTS